MKLLVVVKHDLRTTGADLTRVGNALGSYGKVTPEPALDYPGHTVFGIEGEAGDDVHSRTRIVTTARRALGLWSNIEVLRADFPLEDRVRFALREAPTGQISVYHEPDGASIYLGAQRQEDRITHELVVNTLAHAGLSAEIRSAGDLPDRLYVHVSPLAEEDREVEAPAEETASTEGPKAHRDRLGEILRDVGTVYRVTPAGNGAVVRFRMEHARNATEPERVAELLRTHGFECVTRESFTPVGLGGSVPNHVVIVSFSSASEDEPSEAVEGSSTEDRVETFSTEDRAEIEAIVRGRGSFAAIGEARNGNLGITFHPEYAWNQEEPERIVRALGAAGFVARVRVELASLSRNQRYFVLVDYATSSLVRDTDVPFRTRIERVIGQVGGIADFGERQDGSVHIEFAPNGQGKRSAERLAKYLVQSGVEVDLSAASSGALSSLHMIVREKPKTGIEEIDFHGVRLTYDPAVGVTAMVNGQPRFYVQTAEVSS